MTRIPILPSFDPGNWQEIDAAFAKTPVLELGQHWQSGLTANFAPTRVSVGWSGTSLCFDAHLTDHTIFTEATRRNDELYRLGDTLEFFAGAADDPSYIEYHYAPNRLIMQLAWPQPLHEINVTAVGGITAFMVEDNAARHAVCTTPTGWRVCGIVPATAFGLDVPTLAGTNWDLSFSRYDYQSADIPPVLSSSSKHEQKGFHRRHEWLRATCVDDGSGEAPRRSP